MDEQHIEQDINFEKEIEKIQKITPGKLVKSEIIKINNDGVLVNLGIKSEGIIPINEFAQRGIPDEFKEGKEIYVLIKPEIQDGYRVVSYNQARIKIAWDSLLNSYKNKEPVNCKILKN